MRKQLLIWKQINRSILGEICCNRYDGVVLADNCSKHINLVGGNAFSDQGFENADAEALQARARGVIAKNLPIKT